MHNAKFILSNGNEIYHGNLEKETCAKLKLLIGYENLSMKCGCNRKKSFYYKIWVLKDKECCNPEEKN